MECDYSFGKLSFTEVFGFLLKTDTEFPTPLSSHVDIFSYAKKLSEFSDFSIARINGEIVGMISCYTNNPPEGYISNVCVMSGYQGVGFFAGMFSTLITEVKKRGIVTLSLEVDEENQKAIGVYSHLGFVDTSRHKTIGKRTMRFIVN